MRNVLFIALIITTFLKGAEVHGSEWKFIGGSTLLKGEKTLGYYDTESVEYISGGNVSVWMKAVTQFEFERIMNKEEKQIVDKSAKKLASGYIPPYSSVNPKITFDEAINIITWEEVANSSQIKPRLKILFEINCKEKKIRTISATYYKSDGGVASSENLAEWTYISPESNGETLQKILCKKKGLD